MNKIEAIKTMLTEERIKDLLELLEGTSKYSSDSTENMPKTEEEKMARGDALDHVRFIAKYGFKKNKVVDGEMVFSSRPEGFDEWMELGAPGIEPIELELYLKDNPLLSSN